MTTSKFTLALLATGLLTSLANAQTYYTPGYYTPAAPPVPTYVQPAAPTLTADQLNQLLAPIALYPDPLLTQILAAATYPQDIAQAAQWLQSFPNPSEDDINAQPWDPSVKALVHYPSVLDMMANQPDWTNSLGAAFATQPQDVMNVVQQLRSEAQQANTLTSTPQQQVVNDNGAIEILPAQPDVIYVPQYDPTVVYFAHPGYDQPWITFGPSYGVGAWLSLDWDWRGHRVDDGVRWSRDWRTHDFDHGHAWQHNPGRPLPPQRFVPERFHGVDNRGWNDRPDQGRVFDSRTPRQVDHQQGARPTERPVVGVPHGDQRPQPQQRADQPRVEQPRPEQQRPVEQPRPAVQPRPEQPRPVEQPRAVEQPRGMQRGPIAPPINERPVQGIPRPAPGPAPAPIQRPIERAPAPAPVHNAPAPAFHNEGGGAQVQSSRGRGSLGH